VNRVAVQLGTARLRVAIADPRPRLLAELPVPETGPSGPDLAGYTALLDQPADELLVVHGLGGPPVVPATTAAVVRFVPAAVAALGSVDAVATGDPDRPVPDAVVVDCGHRGTDVVHLAGGRIVAASRVPVGGAVLDAVTAELVGLIGTEQGVRGSVGPAEAHAARETLSLQPAVQVGHPPVELDALALRDALTPSLAGIVDAVRALVDGAGPVPPPVLLIGGVARAPLLAELLDAAGVPDVRVIPHPDSAAVVGALRLPPCLQAGAPPDSRSTAPSASSGGPPEAFWLPPVARPRHRLLRALAVGAAAAVAVAGLHAAGTALPAADPGPSADGGDLVQYGYAVRLPAGWAHTGGLPERRRSLLTPLGAPDGSDLISVERTPLGYDADAEPQRARAELRAEFDRTVRAGAALSGFDDDARVGGRPVVTYRETGGSGATDGDGPSADPTEVDWHVLLDGDAQLSVGCRHTAAHAAVVATACATVVGSLHRTV
jgi:type VII secretion-associated protein (TIGR03931 family)